MQDMNYRVVVVYNDDGCFGYSAPPIIEVIKDGLNKSSAKALYKRLWKKANEPYTSYEIEQFVDGEWQDVSRYWEWDAWAKQEQWFEDMGWNYFAYVSREPGDKSQRFKCA